MNTSEGTIEIVRINYVSTDHFVEGYLVAKHSLEIQPLVMWNRGGNRAWSKGKEFGKITVNSITKGSILRFAQSGYVVLASQLSGATDSGGKDFHGGSEIEDVNALFQIARKLGFIDVNRIGMYGFSRGAITTYRLLARESWIKAAVVQSGITDLFLQAENRPVLKEFYQEAFGGQVHGYKKRSVIYWVDALPTNTPLLLLHGTSDERVPVCSVLTLASRLASRSANWFLILYRGDDHELSVNKALADAEAIKWFQMHL